MPAFFQLRERSMFQSVKIAQSYIVRSKITRRWYLDEERRIFLFFLQSEGEAFCLDHPDTCLTEAAYYDPDDLRAKAYRGGARSIFCTRNGEEEKVPVGPRNVRPGFYQNDLNAWISLLKETQKPVYIKRMLGEWFLVPAKVMNGERPSISYATIHNKSQDNVFYFLAFSDIEEFKPWNSKNPGWQLLRVNLATLYQIGKKHGFVVNVYGNKITLPYDLIRDYRRLEKKNEQETA